MVKEIVLAFLLVLGTAPLVFSAETATFRGAQKKSTGEPFLLSGKLTKPEGNGPFPAVVLLHNCGGISGKQYPFWLEKLNRWGYVSLLVDSLGSRGLASTCEDDQRATAMMLDQVPDAFDAKSFLSGLPFVDPARIGVIGWGWGGFAALSTLYEESNKPFQAGVGFYSGCNRSFRNINAPFLILTGELDPFNPPDRYKICMPTDPAKHEVLLKIFPGAHANFDVEGIDIQLKHGKIAYDPQATAGAAAQVKAFLEKYLK
jgi:dienelactone hydrolase